MSETCREPTYPVQPTNCGAPSIAAAPNSRMPGRHVGRVRRSVGAGVEEPVVVIGIDVVRLHHPHEMHRVRAAGKAAVRVVDVVTNRLGAGESFRADPGGGARCSASEMRCGMGPVSLLACDGGGNI